MLVSVKGAAPFHADLIGPDPADSDAIILDLLGVRRSFKLDEVRINQEPKKFDEYGDIRSNDAKARWDNFAIQLHNAPDHIGYIVAYGRCIGEGNARADQAREYLVNIRGLQSGRLRKIIGGCRTELTMELWLAPPGASPPAVSSEGILQECPSCPKKTRLRRRRR